MKVKDLIDKLQKLNQDKDILIYNYDTGYDEEIQNNIGKNRDDNYYLEMSGKSL